MRYPESVRLSNPAALRPMRLPRIPEPFDHPDFLYDVKFGGFRALAHINGHHCQLVSKQFRRLYLGVTVTGLLRTVSTYPSSSKYLNWYWPGTSGAVIAIVPEVAPLVYCHQPS